MKQDGLTMKLLHTLPFLLGACISTATLAGDYWQDDRYRPRHENRYDRYQDHYQARTHQRRHHDRDGWHDRHDRRVEYIVVERPVYREPRVIYREPVVVYQDRPDYYEAPRYRQERAPRHSRHEEGMSSGTGQVLGAVAGGIIGNRFGDGNGRLATTAAGAVLGGIVGGELARD